MVENEWHKHVTQGDLEEMFKEESSMGDFVRECHKLASCKVCAKIVSEFASKAFLQDKTKHSVEGLAKMGREFLSKMMPESEDDLRSLLSRFKGTFLETYPTHRGCFTLYTFAFISTLIREMYVESRSDDSRPLARTMAMTAIGMIEMELKKVDHGADITIKFKEEE